MRDRDEHRRGARRGRATLHDLRRAALLHDIGKLSVSNRILDKPGPLTRAEFARVREHPLITERILARVPGCEHLAPIAGSHHERLDGQRLPARARARQLTMPMRVLAIADVYEALTSDRPYRRAHSSDEALAVMRERSPSGSTRPRSPRSSCCSGTPCPPASSSPARAG